MASRLMPLNARRSGGARGEGLPGRTGGRTTLDVMPNCLTNYCHPAAALKRFRDSRSHLNR
jgi:hypothetical protein